MLLEKDIERIAQDLSRFEEIRNKSFLVTGASGLLGSLIVKSLMCLNRLYSYNVSVLALVRSNEKAEAAFGELVHNDRLHIAVGDILHIPDIQAPVDFIFHGASATSSKFFVDHPVQTIRTAIVGTENILNLAAAKQISGMVYMSSLEVYGTLHSDTPVGEANGGYIDPLATRSSYSESKRMAENLCCAYFAEYKVPVKIARLTQTFGAGVSYDDNRVFAQFARSVIEKKNIVLHTRGETIRNYCYTTDAIRALFYILLKGSSGEAYNVANADTGISISGMAELAASFEPLTNVVFEIAEPQNHGYNPDVKICLDTSKLNQLGWSAEVGLQEMFRNLIAGMAGKKSVI